MTNKKCSTKSAPQQLSILKDSFFLEELVSIDRQIASVADDNIPALFSRIPLEVFSLLAYTEQQQFPNINAWFPSVPGDETMVRYVGACGIPMMSTSAGFVNSMVSMYKEVSSKPLDSANVLDYGVGWGRLVRLMYKYVSVNNLYAVDAWPQSIELCRSLNVKAKYSLVEEEPCAPPFPRIKFDLIYACSVFTHINESPHRAVLKTLHQSLDDDGLLVLTLRPRDFWQIKETDQRTRLFNDHDGRGFAFLDLGLRPGGENSAFGDASISYDYVKRNWTDWKVVHIGYSLHDFMQTRVFLKKR